MPKLKHKEKIYVGIDPGKQGAIVSLHDRGEVKKFLMPTVGTEFDCHELSKILRWYRDLKQPIHAYLEEVHAIYGSAAGATFTFGGVFYACKQVLADFEISHSLVQPKEWQKEIYQGIPEQRKASVLIKKGKFAGTTKKGPRDTKAMSLVAAKRLFPKFDLRANDRCKKAHDGIVDALLIAEYCRRKENGVI